MRRKSIPHPDYLLRTATHWRMRAEEVRTLAEDAQTSTVRAMMLRLAADYDRLAGNADDFAVQNSIMFRVMNLDDKASAGTGVGPTVKCTRCQDVRWVCENHPDKPWDRDHEERCGGAGMPCPDCNEPQQGERPATDADFIAALDRDKGPVH